MPRIVIASHVAITAYGSWLPNDQRGSWSDYIRRWELLRFGPATKTDVRHSVAYRPFDRTLRDAAKSSLTFPPVHFNAQQIDAVAAGFADGMQRSGSKIYACYILYDHTHLVIGRHSYDVEQVTNRLKGSATRVLMERGLHPFAGETDGRGKKPSPWASDLWKVFRDTPADIARSIEYANNNLVREGQPPQPWPFLKPYV